MEKKTSFLSLVYREYCITKKAAFGNFWTCFLQYGSCIMISLSAKFGNISKINKESDMAPIIEILTPSVRWFGIFFAFLFFMTTADAAASDLKNKVWALYRKSLPVKPFRLALARTAWQAAMFLVSIGISFLYVWIDVLISGRGIDKSDIGVGIILCMIYVLMVVSTTVCIEFAKSYDTGSLMAVGVFTAAVAVFMISNRARFASGPMTVESMRAMWRSFSDFVPLFFAVIVLLFVLEAVLLTLLFKRRDK